MEANKLTRFEIIDHTACKNCQGAGRVEDEECGTCFGTGCPGRTVITRDENKQIDFEIQDEGRTLKVFIHERYSE